MKEGTQKEARALKGIVYQLNILLSFLTANSRMLTSEKSFSSQTGPPHSL